MRRKWKCITIIMGFHCCFILQEYNTLNKFNIFVKKNKKNTTSIENGLTPSVLTDF